MLQFPPTMAAATVLLAILQIIAVSNHPLSGSPEPASYTRSPSTLGHQDQSAAMLSPRTACLTPAHGTWAAYGGKVGRCPPIAVGEYP